MSENEQDEEIYSGMRASFPVSFGKQSKSQTSLETIHKSTLRSVDSSKSVSKEANPFPALSSSSNSWLHSLKKNPNPNPNPNPRESVSGDDVVVGSGRRSLGTVVEEDEEENDDEMIGPPRPPMTEVEIGPPRPLLVGGDEEVEIGPPRRLLVGGDEEVEIGPPRPPMGVIGSDTDDDDDDLDGDEGEVNRYRIPLNNEIVLKGHTKVVSALAIDHSGSRVLSGSYDYTVRMYDFQGMNARLESFRQLEPFEGHQVRSLSWSPTADRFMCVSGSAVAKIYDRDGLTLGEFVKGDMYIRDLKNTKGHISGLTCGEWHPKERETILTSSEDGSLRIWDVNEFKTQKQVIKPRLSKPGRVSVTTCAWNRDGKCIAGGIGDGSIQIWNLKPGWGSRPDIYVPAAHLDDITCLKFSSDGKTLLSRSFDCSLKVWDLRQMKEPVRAIEDLPNNYPQCNIAFSPDEQLFLTGTSIERDSTKRGLLCFYDREKLELVSKVGISPTYSVVQCAWHPKLNQVFATVGDKHHGATHILYDPSLSERGALVSVARAPRKQSIDDFQPQPQIHNPHALPLFRDQPSRKRQREKILKDPLKSHKPEVPMNGPGHGGRVGTTKGSLLTQYLLKQGGLIKETWMDEDPREAILKYADAAEKDPKFIAPAYSQTQPEPVFAKSDSEEDEK